MSCLRRQQIRTLQSLEEMEQRRTFLLSVYLAIALILSLPDNTIWRCDGLGDAGIDRVGNDLPNQPITLNNTATPETCKHLCDANEGNLILPAEIVLAIECWVDN